ncbi:unnamed protein product [Tilletia controversa]|uniref:AB hydrolase-1 domain-containing protein n=1 Tax=Tilletia controversa TaxID=13291 RepID=A0A8X7SXY3_9BASI|nr:hypothetical protein CF328_g2648 [Tilletia controversa]KAE8249327.1 hypothetical protein A4X06_0g3280 [Tilletia controversa]CAD6899359.1 unnamed protein product [Tilletia controversa]
MRFFASLILVSPLLATVACSAPSSFDNAAGPAQLARADRKQHVVAAQPPRYLTLPPTPHLPRPDVETRLGRPDGASIWYAQYGPKKSTAAKKAKALPPVIFLHGGLAASQWLGHQIAHFKETRHVIAIDSRAQGRSTNGNGTLLTYDAMTEDVVAILDHLKISTAALVGWSDGAIIGLDFALNHPSRIDRVFAFAPNYNISGTLDVSVSPVFTEYEARAQKIYEKINPTHNFEIQYDAVTTMWATLPAWNQKDFEAIPSDVGRRVWIVDGDHEEAVKRYQIDDLANWIKGSGELLLPQTSHFAFMQDPSLFNDAIQRLLDITF